MQIKLYSAIDNNIFTVYADLFQKTTEPIIAYLPEASVDDWYIEYTKEAFKGLAEVQTIDTRVMNREAMKAILDRATALYIPGGNAYLLAQRIYEAGLFDIVKNKVINNLPVLAFSAGTVYCGKNILTTNDMNICAGKQFEGLGLQYNFNVHFPLQGSKREIRIERIKDYLQYNDNTVIAMEDGSSVTIIDNEITEAVGNVWRFVKGEEMVRFTL